MRSRAGAITLVAATVLALAALAAATAAGVAGAKRASLIAPLSACLGQEDPGAPTGAQLRAMHCMTNYARKARGLQPLNRVKSLDRAAGRKAADMIACDEFSHQACGREFTYWLERFGYLPRRGCWRAAENIAWGSGSLGAVRAIFTAWIRSPGHRRNILAGSLEDLGVGLRSGELEGNPGAHVWTQAFASRDC